MRCILYFILLVFSQTFYAQKYVLVIHGGAGTIEKSKMTPQREAAYREALTRALQAGYSQIQAGSSAVDAVAAAIVVLEDSPLFNAGKGAVFTHEGKNELDAAIMYGKDKSAGAVAGVQTIKNPIKAAIAVMRNSEHVMLSGRGAETFAAEQKLDIVPNSYFYTEDRWKGLQKALEVEKTKLKTVHKNDKPASYEVDQKFGTVGAVALDKAGNLAAGTSTGGMTNKRWNRIGDTPVIGAGNYANAQVGISGTGWGEYFIRSTAARTVAARMEYLKESVEEAAAQTLAEIASLGGDGGLIALDNQGNIAMPFNTAGMFRGAVTKDGKIVVNLYKEADSTVK